MYTDGKIIVNVDLSDTDLTIVESFEEVQEGEKWFKLTDDQIAFQAENTEADITEVIACRLGKYAFDKAKEVKINAIEQADKSASVFYANDIPMWIDKELRNSLLNVTLPALKEAGKETTLLWYEGIPPVSIEVSVDMLLHLIPQLELYAKEVYDNTQTLKAAVYNAGTEEALNEIELTGYPKPLKFTI